MRQGIKHLIECHCVLPQYRKSEDPPFHKFVVFSIIDEYDNIVPKCVQCNNCGVIHRVIDIAKSEAALGNDNSASVISIDDIKLSLPENIARVLENYQCDIPTWEEAQFFVEEGKWGSKIILTTEYLEEEIRGKYLLLESERSIKILSYVRKTTV